MKTVGTGEITVDSAAEESVCPPSWGEEFGLIPVAGGDEMRLVNASGGRIKHHGSREVVFRPIEGCGSGKMIGMGFQVSDVKKALAAVWKICQKGNVVQFGPEETDNFIKNKMSGDIVYLKRKGGSYILEVEFVMEAGGDGNAVFQRQGR